MKKLLYTTAIAGAVLSGVAQAETKVTGNLALSWNAAMDDKTTGQSSWRNFGKESQINISNSGDLNNGWKYAAGFSIEMDGNDGSGTSAGDNVTASKLAGQQDENVYIDFINGNTTISIGMDHFQNTDVHLSNIVGFGYINAAGASQNAASVYPRSNNVTAYNKGYGIGVAQKTDAGSLGIYYTPAKSYAGNDNCDLCGNQGNVSAGESAREINFVGGFGVQGLKVVAGKMWQDLPSSLQGDTDGQRVAFEYKFGKATIAADDSKYNTGTATRKGRSYGVAYALSDNLSLGVTTATAKAGTSGTVDEKTNMIALGYNLGAVSVQAQLKDVEALGGTSGQDGQIAGIYLNTKF